MTRSADYLAQHFTNYMFRMVTEENRKHVQRVTAWFGLLALAIHAHADHWQFNRERQLIYSVGDHWFKVRFEHKLSNGTRGGIVILEVHGNKDGKTWVELGCLADVEEFYLYSIRKAKGRIAA